MILKAVKIPYGKEVETDNGFVHYSWYDHDEKCVIVLVRENPDSSERFPLPK